MIKCIENCIEPSLFDKLKNQVLNFNTFPWFFIESTAIPDQQNGVLDYSWFHMTVYDGVDNSDNAPLCRDISKQIQTYVPDEYNFVDRIKFGMHTAQETPFVNKMHIDSTTSHFVGLLYINDSDGDTIIYDRLYSPDDNIEEEYNKEDNQFKILKRITPKSNTALIFDGRYYHASTCSTKSKYRVTMNINYLLSCNNL